jgi:hypothetical protein
MRAMRVVFPLVTLTALCACAMSVAEARQNVAQNSQQNNQSDNQQVTVPLSDPARPATLTVRLMSGGVTIRGASRKDMLIESQPIEERRRGRGYGRGRGGQIESSTGLRRLTQSGGFTVEGDNNMVQVTSQANRGTDLTIHVPTRTNLKLSTLNDGPIVVENVEGEIEVNNQNESVALTNVAGSIVANAHNGRVTVVMTRVAADKAMAFTSFNGNVDVTLPASVKAILKMRSDMGEIFTDFDVQMRPVTAVPQTLRSDGPIRIDVNRSIQGAVNGGGPEFELRTFNGNIYVRKGAQ